MLRHEKPIRALANAEQNGGKSHSGRGKIAVAALVAVLVVVATVTVAAVLFLNPHNTPDEGAILGTTAGNSNSAPLNVGGVLIASYSPYVKAGVTYQWYVISTSEGTLTRNMGTVAVLANYSTLSDKQILGLQECKSGGGIIVQVNPDTMQITGILQPVIT